jgi:hypothetical protein
MDLPIPHGSAEVAAKVVYEIKMFRHAFDRLQEPAVPRRYMTYTKYNYFAVHIVYCCNSDPSGDALMHPGCGFVVGCCSWLGTPLAIQCFLRLSANTFAVET